jgi:DNA invertase Pin-like site-specific DNA recombinase
MTRKRAALYHRTSTLDQDPTLARGELRGAAERLQLDVVLDVEETGSGARNDRPGLQRIMEAARRGKLDAVLVWKLDRFGRSALDVLANIRSLEDAGVRFVCTSQGIDVTPNGAGDATSRLIVTVLAAVAEFERDLIRERTALGLEKARAAGVRLGRRPKDAPPVFRIRELREAGYSWAMVGAALGIHPSHARRIAAAGNGRLP